MRIHNTKQELFNPDNDKRKNTIMLFAKMTLFLLFYFPQFFTFSVVLHIESNTTEKVKKRFLADYME